MDLDAIFLAPSNFCLYKSNLDENIQNYLTLSFLYPEMCSV